MPNNCVFSVIAAAVQKLYREPTLAQLYYLLHMDGVQGGTTFNDERGHVFSPTGTKTDTANFKFGTASLDAYGYLYRTMAAPELIGTKDFTLEAWVRPTGFTSGVNGIFNVINNRSNSTGFSVYARSDGSLVFWTNNGAFISTPVGAIALNKWQHVAVTRENGTIRLWVNGKALAGGGGSPANYTDNQFYIGYAFGYENGNTMGTLASGNIDEVRFCVGLSAYYQQFTPPDTPFVVPAA